MRGPKRVGVPGLLSTDVGACVVDPAKGACVGTDVVGAVVGTVVGVEVGDIVVGAYVKPCARGALVTGADVGLLVTGALVTGAVVGFAVGINSELGQWHLDTRSGYQHTLANSFPQIPPSNAEHAPDSVAMHASGGRVYPVATTKVHFVPIGMGSAAVATSSFSFLHSHDPPADGFWGRAHVCPMHFSHVGYQK